MKCCPSCNRVETDDALAFCRADGTALVSDSSSTPGNSSPSFASANASSEIETSILPHSTDAGISRATAVTTVVNAHTALARPHVRPSAQHSRIASGLVSHRVSFTSNDSNTPGRVRVRSMSLIRGMMTCAYICARANALERRGLNQRIQIRYVRRYCVAESFQTIREPVTWGKTWSLRNPLEDR